MSSRWVPIKLELRVIKQALSAIAAARGLIQSTSTISNFVGTFLESISSVALAQKTSSFQLDKSSITEAVVAILTSLNKGLAEIYLYTPLQNYRTRTFKSLMTLFKQSIQAQHLGTIDASITGVTNNESIFTIPVQSDVSVYKQQINSIPKKSVFTGFTLVAVSDNTSEYERSVSFFQSLLRSNSPSHGRVDTPQPRVYNWGSLITPYVVSSSDMFDSVWSLVRNLQQVEQLATTPKSPANKLKNLGVLLQTQASTLKQFSDSLANLQSSLNIDTDLNLNALVFVDQTIENLESCLLSSPNAPNENNLASGFITVVDNEEFNTLFQTLIA